MKILLINNNTIHLKALNQALLRHDVQMQVYKPGLKFDHAGKDLIILSGGGGEGNEINDVHQKGKLWYQDQMEFVLSCKKPIVGICMGFEVIARAYGEKVEEMPKLLEGVFQLRATKKGRVMWGRKQLKQHEAHKWRVPDIKNKYFEVLADSDTGIEIIRHRQKPIIASQFHPEEGGYLDLQSLIKTNPGRVVAL